MHPNQWQQRTDIRHNLKTRNKPGLNLYTRECKRAWREQGCGNMANIWQARRGKQVTGWAPMRLAHLTMNCTYSR